MVKQLPPTILHFSTGHYFDSPVDELPLTHLTTGFQPTN
jgi:hypothetical protein